MPRYVSDHQSERSTPRPVLLTLCRVLFATSRPDQLLLIVAVYLFGVTVAAGYGADPTSTVVLWSLGPLVLVAASVHYANEFADYETDALTDRTPFSGGSGALHRTGFSRRVPLYAGAVSLGIGTGLTAWLWYTGVLSSGVVALLGAIAVLGWQYSVAPLKLAWRGLGELDNAVLGGILLPVYGGTVGGGQPGLVALACVPFFFLVLLNLFATQWPDREADAAVGKRTLAVRWPARRLRRVYTGVAVLAGMSVLLLALTILPAVVALASLLVAPLVGYGAAGYTVRHVPWPTAGAMLGLLGAQFAAWLWVVVS